MKVDVLKETIEVLKKDPGADLKRLTKRKKAAIIGALEEKYALPTLLRFLDMARSSYYYQKAALSRSDKYALCRGKGQSDFQ